MRLLAFVYAVLLSLCCFRGNLWTDEAFSAYVASQKSIGFLASALLRADSADIQTAGYYVYLHYWSSLFSASELGLRSANLPFIILFAFALAAVSRRVFQSRFLWIVPGLFPFVWTYAGEARGYFAVLALSTVSFGSLLIYFESVDERERRRLARIVLLSLLIGAAFQMLMLLAVAPLLLIIGLHALLRRSKFHGRDWTSSARLFLLPYLLLFAYFAWSFGRGVNYTYGRPTVSGILSVFARFAGTVGYLPNRYYPHFGPYLPGILLAGFCLVVGIAALCAAGLSQGNRFTFTCLASALAVGLLQSAVLAFVLGQQIQLRHLAVLVPLVLFTILSALKIPQSGAAHTASVIASVALAGVWAVSEYRLLVLPEYKNEDFPSVIKEAQKRQNLQGGDVVLLADPFASAYYGMLPENSRSCFPVADDCATALAKVDWKQRSRALYAFPWRAPEIQDWLNHRRRAGIPVTIIVSEWHPIYSQSAWVPIIQSDPAFQRRWIHGFTIYASR